MSKCSMILLGYYKHIKLHHIRGKPHQTNNSVWLEKNDEHTEVYISIFSFEAYFSLTAALY